MHRAFFPIDNVAVRRIQTVTVAGITGAIGPPVVRALTRAGFRVQALTRGARQHDLMEFNQKRVDYEDARGLRTLLEGQDAVISCLGDTQGCIRAQDALLKASIEAGVKRFMPSEFGSDTTNAYVRQLPFFYSKVGHQRLLRDVAAKHKDFSYTILITGLFLDWCLGTVPCIINIGSRTSQVYDGGHIPFSTTRTSTVACTIAKLLLQPEASHNRVYKVHELVTTQKELIRRSSRLFDRSSEFRCTHIDTNRYEQEAWRAFKRQTGDPLEWIVPFINLSVWSKTHPGYFDVTDNKELDVPILSGRERVSLIDAELVEAFNNLSRPSMISQTGPEMRLADRAYEKGKAKLIDRHDRWSSDQGRQQVHTTC